MVRRQTTSSKLTQTPQPPQDLHNPVHPRQVPGKPRGLPPAPPHLANVMGTHSHVERGTYIAQASTCTITCACRQDSSKPCTRATRRFKTRIFGCLIHQCKSSIIITCMMQGKSCATRVALRSKFVRSCEACMLPVPAAFLPPGVPIP